MKSTIIPAQITTVEDRFSGNLSLQQILLLSGSVFNGFAIYVFMPSFLKLEAYKIVLMMVSFFVISGTAVRINGKLVLFWIITIFKYNQRPQYFVFNKNSMQCREGKTNNEIKINNAIPVKKASVKMLPISFEDRSTLHELINRPLADISFSIGKRGELYVNFRKV
jgi:hypothetical protein